MFYAKALLNTLVVLPFKHITYQCGEIFVTEFRYYCNIISLFVGEYKAEEPREPRWTSGIENLVSGFRFRLSVILVALTHL